MSTDGLEMVGVREYGEGDSVLLKTTTEDSFGEELPTPRLTLVATNECGYNATSVDLLDVLQWVKRYRPDLLEGL